MKKKIYESPIAEVICFQNEEILTGENFGSWPDWGMDMDLIDGFDLLS